MRLAQKCKTPCFYDRKRGQNGAPQIKKKIKQTKTKERHKNDEKMMSRKKKARRQGSVGSTLERHKIEYKQRIANTRNTTLESIHFTVEGENLFACLFVFSFVCFHFVAKPVKLHLPSIKRGWYYQNNFHFFFMKRVCQLTDQKIQVSERQTTRNQTSLIKFLLSSFLELGKLGQEAKYTNVNINCCKKTSIDVRH